MPLGIPKVPFQGPDDETSSWVDLYNRLYRQRFLFLGEEIDSEISNNIIGIMVFLNLEDPTKDQYLFLNCPGGGVIPGVGIYDAIQYVTPDVHTINVGLAASMGSFLLVGGTITKRMAFPHARVMMHEPSTSFIPDSQQTREFLLEVGELAKFREAIIEVYVQRTGNPAWVITRDLERDVFMSATEAKAYGIVDLVGVETI
uniref:ATP-dependent Clp protease proteolytic subunit n=2 Tax=Dipterocarpoideae TaxID=65009 RepID=A0A873A3T1_9ROSI|nr:ATP-dependent Clp protease proteolytic subunit [Dipterocarpus retusus]QOY45571.1 ATP-dependent Clp protease proteolytic subunit [Hopea hainanensis]QXV92954.1 clp protease proteolytic subunit [Dipterocarpus gracilis]UXX17807.1 ATP-dependent Clp protease proteolytic subunit [Dipterocarpus retusus]